MSSLVVENIGRLVCLDTHGRRRLCGAEMMDLPGLADAYLLVENGIISGWGSMSEVPGGGVERRVNARGGMVFPSFCDSHTHLVYAGSREIEYTDKIRGLSYEEIAARGGGILNSAKLLRETSEDELFDQSYARVEEIRGLGTGAVEIKSGYGLTLESELKMLRVIRRIRERTDLTVRATFLAAHAVPQEYRGRQGGYVDLIVEQMIPRVADEGLADFIDVFCDRGFFTPAETSRMLEQGLRYGLKPKIHANELDYSGGIQVGVQYGALSVDHLEYTGSEEIACLLGSETMPTVLPGAALFLGMVNAPVREMISAGLPVALASDYNPGSSPSGSMKFIVSLGCIRLRMLPEEAINATTLNSAYAMGVSDILGSLAVGKRANFFITEPMPSVEYFPYMYTAPLIDRVFIGGEE